MELFVTVAAKRQCAAWDALPFDCREKKRNMRTTHVVMLPYDLKWNEDFSAIRAELEAAMGNVKSYAQN